MSTEAIGAAFQSSSLVSRMRGSPSRSRGSRNLYVRRPYVIAAPPPMESQSNKRTPTVGIIVRVSNERSTTSFRPAQSFFGSSCAPESESRLKPRRQRSESLWTYWPAMMGRKPPCWPPSPPPLGVSSSALNSMVA